MGFTFKPWAELTPDELYDALALRQSVFSVEQRCAFQDCDGIDRVAWHVMGRAADAMLVAYARVLPPGAKYDEVSIGRVVAHRRVRRTGVGRALMAEALARSQALYPRAPIRISAQRYLERFYGEFGFVPTGEPYIEDDIAHIQMVRGA